MSLFQTCFNFSPVREAQYGQYYMRSKSSIAFHGNVPLGKAKKSSSVQAKEQSRAQFTIVVDREPALVFTPISLNFVVVISASHSYATQRWQRGPDRPQRIQLLPASKTKNEAKRLLRAAPKKLETVAEATRKECWNKLEEPDATPPPTLPVASEMPSARPGQRNCPWRQVRNGLPIYCDLNQRYETGGAGAAEYGAVHNFDLLTIKIIIIL
ncbi:hypothetical protein MMC16_004495 [Acarospora aff. strigata]|nr:hypothetical protein [Acarospora aff. strigata]